MDHPYGILALQLRLQADALLGALQQRYAPAAIYCYGLRVSRSLHTGCFSQSQRQERADMDLLLLLTEEAGPERGHDAQDFAAAHYTGGSVSLLCHSRAAAQLALERGHRFFATVAAQGHLLCGQALEMPNIPAPGNEDAFAAYAPRAEGFYRAACGCVSHSPALCLFLLHQAAEQALAGAIGRHTGYRAATHSLGRLLGLCQSFTATLDWFAGGSREERRRFMLLQQSYSAARYGSGFDVSPADAACLLQRVRSLLNELQAPALNKQTPFPYEPMPQTQPAAAVQDDLRAVEP